MVDFEANAKEIVKDFQKFSVMMIGLKVRGEINREFEHTVKINNDIPPWMFWIHNLKVIMV